MLSQKIGYPSKHALAIFLSTSRFWNLHSVIASGHPLADEDTGVQTVANFMQWLVVHLSRVNIRANAIAPGFFETNHNHALLFGPDGTYSERLKKILGMTPMKRFGKVESWTGTLLWLTDN